MKTAEPDHVKVVNANDGWEEIEFALDSGATEMVMGEDMLSSVEIKQGASSKWGVEYEIATGELIPNLGEEKFQAVSQEGATWNITAPGMRSQKGPDEFDEGDAGWHLSGV